MNKKATTPITIVFWIIVFGILFFMGLAQFLGYWSISAVASVGWTGLEAFLMSNMLLWFIIVVIISILAYAYIGGNQ